MKIKKVIYSVLFFIIAALYGKWSMISIEQIKRNNKKSLCSGIVIGKYQSYRSEYFSIAIQPDEHHEAQYNSFDVSFYTYSKYKIGDKISMMIDYSSCNDNRFLVNVGIYVAFTLLFLLFIVASILNKKLAI